MITEWRLRDFKSVAYVQPLIFRKLTIFAGPNSSGKSTVLQSMLLMAQTLASKVSKRHLVLNGELVRLGTFEDVLHEQSKAETIDVGFTFRVDAEMLRAAGSSNKLMLFARSASLQNTADYDFSVDLGFGKPATDLLNRTRQLQPELKRGEFSVIRHNVVADRESLQGRPKISLQLARRSENDAELTSHLSLARSAQQPAVDVSDFLYSVKISPEDMPARRRLRRLSLLTLGPTPESVSVGLEHFLPYSLVQRYTLGPRLLEQVFEVIAENSSSEIDTLMGFWSHENPVFQEAAKSIKAIAQERSVATTDLARRIRSLVLSGGARYEEDNVKLIRRIEQEVQQNVPETIYRQPAFEHVPPPDAISMLNAAVTAIFSAVRYLGPLRDEPRAVHGIANSADPADVGAKGQYTAAVLDLYAGKLVDFVSPDDLDAAPRKVTLADAVKSWMIHFGLAESFRTTEEGKLGHRLLIKPSGMKKDVDLTNVGVGVSQVLPIIVMSLISEPGSVLLFEQPEFHVHPRVQSLLADFFLAVIRTGRQCLIETHSEYLVNRLRLRAARAPLNAPVHNDIMLFFVARPGAASVFRTIAMNEFGAIPDWPEGFFDQGPDEAEQILQAARVKRRIIDEFFMRWKREDGD